MLWRYFALKKNRLECVRKTHLFELHYRPCLDHRGLSCVFDGGSRLRPAIAIVRAATLAHAPDLSFPVQVLAIPVIVTQALAVRATVVRAEHPRQSTQAAMEPEQTPLCLSPEAWGGASCARASICACLACNTLTCPRATLRTKPDSRNFSQLPATTNQDPPRRVND